MLVEKVRNVWYSLTVNGILLMYRYISSCGKFIFWQKKIVLVGIFYDENVEKTVLS